MFHLCVVFAAKLPDPEAREVEGRKRVSQVPPLASQSSGPQHQRKEHSQLSSGRWDRGGQAPAGRRATGRMGSGLSE